MAEVLVTGGDTELGRVIATGFKDAGHNVIIAGSRRDDLEVAAKELEVESIVFDATDPASLEEAGPQFPHHIDTLVNVPAPRWDAKDPRTFTLADHAAAWREALDATVVSAALTIQIIGDHLRSGGTIVNIVAETPREGSAEAAIRSALADWTAGQAGHFGARGITINAVAPGRGSNPGYDGLSSTPQSVADEIARLAVFLTTPAARHITGQTMHVGRGALAGFA
ncbi:SDR family oxidoreductase [Mycobacterium sp. 155]|uniref:SDR family oxidoreductase n=1 Tax=Mycobacterium sp. 155 TaxID=1157943 RepID=UPI00035CEA4A|nr:SDR family oxidoreductase [Mycobacterium sp. 155]